MKKAIFICISIFGVLSGFGQAISIEQPNNEKKPMSVVDFLNIPGISNPRLSPSGKEIIYVLSESDWKANKQVGHLWKADIEGTEISQFTYGIEGEDNPEWSPDGKWISFLTKRNGNKEKQIYLMRRDGGEGFVLTKHKTSVSNPIWSRDGKSIYFIAKDTINPKEQKAKKLKDDVFLLDEDYKQSHLYKVSIEDKGETRITKGEFSVMDYDLSRDGSQILYHRGINPLYDSYKNSEIWIMDSDGSNGRQLTDNSIGEQNARISPNKSQLLFLAGANEDFESYYNTKLFLLPTEGNSKAITPIQNWTYDIIDAEWSKDGGSIYLKVNMGSETQLWQYQLSKNKLLQLTKGEHSIEGWDYEPQTDQIVLAKNTIKNPGDLFTIKANQLKKITKHYDYLDAEFYLPKQEVITWKGKDGVPVEGIIYYPHDYNPEVKYPLVVQTHGGPASSDKYGFSRSFTRYNAVLTGKGYVVLQPNYRGSTGYGDDFLRDMVGGYFKQSHLDVMKGVDYLINKGIANSEKMVKMGWSAGGHMTNKIITFTDRFKAASSGAGAVNWIGMYAQSDIRTYRTPWFGGSPWQENPPIDVYWNNSPLKDISNVTTPTLVIVGENDPRVPLSQSVELYRALRSLNVPTHLYIAPREPHGWVELRHRLYKINVELEWFAKYALGEVYQWEEVEELKD